MNYNDAIIRLKDLNNMKHKLRKALGSIGIYLPLTAGMKEVLFCVYVYYMFNLFGDNNSKWKEKYFPLDGMTLYRFIEGSMTANHTDNKIYIDIANEIESVTYPGRTGQSNTILNRGLIEEFINYEQNDDVKSKVGEISNNKIDTDNVLTNTKGLLNKLLSIWKWKKLVIEGTRRKRKEDKQTPVIEENALLDDILQELIKEPSYRLPKLNLDKIKLTNEKMTNINNYQFTSSVNYPYTIYSYLKEDRYITLEDMYKRLFTPHYWSYNTELEIDNMRPNTAIGIYYKKQNGSVDINSDFPGYTIANSVINDSWDKKTKKKVSLYDISLLDIINIGYKDKYNGIYDKNNGSTSCYMYLGWKPEIFLYSKGKPKEMSLYDHGESEAGMYNMSIGNSPMDYMNSLDNDEFGNLGLTILVPSVVERFMKEKAHTLERLKNGIITQYGNSSFNYFSDLNMVNTIRGIETVFLVGIYPVDENDNIVYKDPIVFQFFSGEQLNDDLGLSFADYRKIKSPTTRDKVLLRKYYNIKLGQMFYRNNYSRVSTEKKITNVVTEFDNELRKEVLKNITYENRKVGDISKNLLYLYGMDAYMPYVGKTPLSPGQNHNITNPDDNTYIQNIKLPDNVEYTFKKYGNTKIAIQLYMATNNDISMNGLEYFKKIKEANGGIINDSNTPSSETLENIPGNYMGLPYKIENTWNMGVSTTIHKAFPYNESYVINKKIIYPNYMHNDGYSMSLDIPRGLAYITEPVIIDCNKSNEYNAPWLDKRNAPYVAKVVIEDFEYYSKKRDTRTNIESVVCTTMKKGIYIKIPNDLSLYMLNDKSVEKYIKRKAQNKEEISIEDKEFYGRIKRDKYIRVIKNALLGITVNYNPYSITEQRGVKNPSWYYTSSLNNKLFTSPEHFDIIEYDEELYIRLDGKHFDDLEFAGLGKFGTVKVQLIFRNEFFRSDDPDSPLNYKYVPTTGDVQLLREIAGQRIKLYRGGILAHPTDYATKGDRNIYKHILYWTPNVPNGMSDAVDVPLTKDIAYKHAYTKGFPTFAMDSNNLYSVYSGNNFNLSDDNSVYDIISIEMDYPHWQELQVNNIERSPISSMETDTNDISLPIPVNIIDLENFDFLEYNIEENSYIDRFYRHDTYLENTSFSPKLSLRQPDEDKENQIIVPKNIDFYRMLNFWYIFRPKVKFYNERQLDTNSVSISIEPYNEWRTRILTENRDYFNRKNMKISDTDNRIVDLEDIFNIRCYKDSYDRSSYTDIINIVREYNKDPNSQNLYNIMKYIILNHTVYIDSTSNTIVKDSFNINNKKAKFGGYILDKLLYSDWVFTYRKGDSKKIDDILRQSANDAALYLFNMWYNTTNHIREQYNNTNFNNSNRNIQINDYDYVKNSFNNLLKEFMMNDSNAYIGSGVYNIYADDFVETQLPGTKRLIDFKANNNCTLKPIYERGERQENTNTLYNVWNNRIYKGDNRKLDINNSKAKLRRGFRMGDKTPDNPFMGFSMPATTNPDLVPDYIHLVYCDIYWKDFDKTPHEIQDTSMDMSFSTSSDKNIITGTYDMTYDFTGIIEKYHLNVWLSKGKHVIFRVLVDEPTNEKHKDCPDYIKGEYYDNKYGKGFSPDFKNDIVKFHYKHAILALRRWINEHNDLLNGVLYTVEIPLGISGNGNMVTNGNIIPIPNINIIYNDVYSNFFYRPNGLIREGMAYCKLIFSSSIFVTLEKESIKRYGWLFNNLGNREYFEDWMKYNMYGTDSTIGSSIVGGSLHGGNIYINFNNSVRNKFKSFQDSHIGYSGVIRSDLSMDELMKPEIFRELLYEMKTITPMYVIGYVDKEKYPEQYEALMNEMGYKYTITSAVIEDNYLKVYYSNEGKNGIKSISDNANLTISLKFKNKLKNVWINHNADSIMRDQTKNRLNSIGRSLDDISNTKINMGDVKMLNSSSPVEGNYVTRPYVYGVGFNMNSSVQNAYGKDMVDDVYLELNLGNEFVNIRPAIKLANVNRTTEINLTDSGLLHMFISNHTTGRKEGDPWFDTMYLNYIKVDDNGWI